MHSLLKDLMTTPVVTVEPATPFKEIVARLAEHRVSAVPVVDDDGRVLGVVSEADLLLKEDPPPPRSRSETSTCGPGRPGVEGVVRVENRLAFDVDGKVLQLDLEGRHRRLLCSRVALAARFKPGREGRLGDPLRARVPQCSTVCAAARSRRRAIGHRARDQRLERCRRCLQEPRRAE